MKSISIDGAFELLHRPDAATVVRLATEQGCVALWAPEQELRVLAAVVIERLQWAGIHAVAVPVPPPVASVPLPVAPVDRVSSKLCIVDTARWCIDVCGTQVGETVH